jgi:hypothetical protein
MKLRECIGCGRPVLELRGQFTLLNSFYINDGVPPVESAGEWHLSCLHGSGYGAAWYEARRRNFVDIRKYDVILESEAWTVTRNPRTREPVALSPSGDSLLLVFAEARPRPVPGGAIYRVDEEYNLELDDREAIKAIQGTLSTVGAFPLLAVMEVLGIADRVVHAEALEEGMLRVDHELRGEWQPGFVSARADYGVFVPAELEPHVVRRRAP